MTLIDGKKGESYTVTGINLEDEEKRRLYILGVNPATRVKILEAKRGGSVIIKVRSCRFAIGKKFACGIEIKPETEDKSK